MKKTFLLILTILIIINYSLFSLPIGGTAIIKLSDDFYSEMDLLFLSLGKAVSKTRPYSANEAIVYLKSIENEKMRDSERAIYNKLLKQVALGNNDNVYNFSTRGLINPEVFFHTNTKFRDDITYDDKDKPTEEYTKSYSPFSDELSNTIRKDKFMTVGLDLIIKSNAALHFELPIENSVHTLVPFGSTHFINNIPFVSSFYSFSYEDFNFNFPYRAFISIGNEWWNLELGREQYSFGSGKTGNFIVDGHLPYHSALNVSAFTPSLKVNFLASFFPYPDQYETKMDVSDSSTTLNLKRYFDQNTDAFTGVKMLLDHRIEWISKDRKSRLALEEAIIYQNDKGIVDLQVLNPLMFFHNLYIAGNSNSILSLEWDYVFTKGIEQSVAIVIDDLNIPGEKKHASEAGDDAKPDAVGIQLGLKTATPISNGFLKSTIEATFTSPALYLRDSNYDTGYTLNYIVAIRNQRSNHGVYDLTYLGYPYGCNAFNFLFALSYVSMDDWTLGLEAEFNAKGPVNLMSRYSRKDGDRTIYPFLKLLGGTTQYSLRVTTGGAYSISKNFDILSSMTFYSVWNMNNDPNIPFEFDYEIMAGCRYTF